MGSPTGLGHPRLIDAKIYCLFVFFLLLFVAFVTPAHILNEEFAQTPPSPISGEELATAAADESG